MTEEGDGALLTRDAASIQEITREAVLTHSRRTDEHVGFSGVLDSRCCSTSARVSQAGRSFFAAKSSI
jgi:hypothetical protein